MKLTKMYKYDALKISVKHNRPLKKALKSIEDAAKIGLTSTRVVYIDPDVEDMLDWLGYVVRKASLGAGTMISWKYRKA